jgi:hypothetical protein
MLRPPAHFAFSPNTSTFRIEGSPASQRGPWFRMHILIVALWRRECKEESLGIDCWGGRVGWGKPGPTRLSMERYGLKPILPDLARRAGTLALRNRRRGRLGCFFLRGLLSPGRVGVYGTYNTYMGFTFLLTQAYG